MLRPFRHRLGTSIPFTLHKAFTDGPTSRSWGKLLSGGGGGNWSTHRQYWQYFGSIYTASLYSYCLYRLYSGFCTSSTGSMSSTWAFSTDHTSSTRSIWALSTAQILYFQYSRIQAACTAILSVLGVRNALDTPSILHTPSILPARIETIRALGTLAVLAVPTYQVPGRRLNGGNLEFVERY